MTEAGMVHLVGAGPGGADLITVRGAARIARADVVVFDRLVDPELLDLAPPDATRHCVGKSKGGGVTQSAINDLLISLASAGHRVVRLKGGDPFVFGRGSEERIALEAAGIECEVVPGLSSSLTAPALAGIPVTHRGAAASFTVITGHRIRDADHDWDALGSGTDTLVVLMGASTAHEIARRLISHGRSVDEPVAFVHNAGRDDQETVISRLDEVAEHGCPLPSPVVTVIGTVVNFAPDAPSAATQPIRLLRAI